jgi:hypothetical protein
VYDDADLSRFYCGVLAIPSVVLDADLFINVAKLKTHNRTKVSLCMKNQWGLLSAEDRKMYHRLGLHEPIAKLALAVRPHLAIIDGIIGLEGNGPLNGISRKAGVLLMGSNLVETDIVGSRLIGEEPREVIHLQQAVAAGLATWDVEVKGALQARLVQRFEPAPLSVKKKGGFHLWRNHRACHLDDESFQAAIRLARRTPQYWMFFAKLAYFSAFGRIDLVRGRGARMPPAAPRQRIILSGDCSRALIKPGDNLPPNVIHIPGCPPDPEAIVKAILAM